MTTQIKAGVIAANAITASELASSALSGGSFTGDVTFDTDTLVIDSSNNRVGIGVASPNVKLEITDSTSPIIKLSRDGGTAATQGYTTYGHSNIGYSGGTGADTHIVSQHGIGLVINEGVGIGATALVITDGGLVGIGNTNPTRPLDVLSSSTGQVPVANFGTSGAGGQALILGVNTTTETTYLQNNTSSSYDMEFIVNGNQRLLITSDGNIGINNSSPYGTAQISVNTGTKDYTIYSESTDVNNYISLRDSTSTANIIFGAEGDAHVFKADGTTRASMGSTYTLKLTGSGGSGNLTFETTDSSNNQTFFVSDGGTVGVRYAAFMVGKNNSTARANNAAIDFSGTNTAMAIPYGSRGQRSASPSNAGYMRWNYTLEHIENWSGTGWGSIGGKSQGEQLARQYCARTGGSIRYVSAGSGSLNSDLDAISDGDALLIAPGSYTITRKTSGYVSEHNPFREKECGVFGDTNYAGDVTISHNPDADTDIRDHPIWCARWNGLYTHPLFLGFIKYVRNPSTLNNTNYSDAIVNGTFSDGSAQMICGGAQNVLFDFNGTNVAWVYDNASAVHYMRFKNCTFSNYNVWEGSYSGNLRDGYVWHCVFQKSSNPGGYYNAVGYDIAMSTGSITNRTLLSKGNKHGVSLSGTGSTSGTYDVDTNAGAGHLQYDPFPTIFWDDENWPGDY